MKTSLLVEDDENDVLFLRHAWTGAGIPYPLQVVSDGQQALDYLAGSGRFENRREFPIPCLVLLDLNLPYRSGFEVLQWIRQHPALYTILVVILTSSNAEQDAHHAYRLGANSYVIKPNQPDQLKELANLLHSYWLKWNLSPPACDRFKLAT